MTKEDIKQICQIYDNFRSELDVATIAYNSDDTFWEHILATYNLSQPSIPSNLDEAAEKYSERIRDGKDKLYAFHGFRDGALWRDSQIQRLSNGIDGAAELSANDAMIKRQFPSVVYNTGLKCFDHSDLIKQFKAGAKWDAAQGVSMLGRVGIYGVDVESITKELREAGFNLGEEIILQIRKKQ